MAGASLRRSPLGRSSMVRHSSISKSMKPTARHAHFTIAPDFATLIATFTTSRRRTHNELERHPAGRKWRHADDTSMGKEHADKHEERDEETPVEIFAELERVASAHDGAEGYVGGST